MQGNQSESYQFDYGAEEAKLSKASPLTARPNDPIVFHKRKSYGRSGKTLTFIRSSFNKREHMERYRNIGGDSAVRAYQIGDDSIQVQFTDLSVYLYNNRSTGSTNIEHMKALAMAGQGLNSFISRVVKKAYASKLR
jgi:hypothetical protein